MSRGVQGKNWRLYLSVQHRSGAPTAIAQKAVLIITVVDPLKKAPVYDEMSPSEEWRFGFLPTSDAF